MTINHPLSLNQKYTVQEDGNVRVEVGKKWGLFDPDGKWIEGDLKSCDPQMCRWLASEVIMRRYEQSRESR